MIQLIGTLNMLACARFLGEAILHGLADEHEMAEENLRKHPNVVRWFGQPTGRPDWMGGA